MSEEDLEMGIVNQMTTEPSDAPPHSSRERTRTTYNAGMLTMPAGHPRLAELMSRRPHMSIYRRFGYLNTQNLLYMQAELVGLENKLKVLQKQDAGEIDEQVPQDNNRRRAGDWKELSKAIFPATQEAGGQNNEESLSRGASCCGHRRCEEWCCGERKPHEHCDQWNLAVKISEKLHRYNDALIQQMTINSVGVPNSYDLKWIQSFLASDTFGMRGALLGEDKLLWGVKESWDEAEHMDELIALTSPPKQNPLSELVFKRIMRLILDPASVWNKVLRIRSFHDRALFGLTTAATGAVAATIPILSVVVLYFTPDINVRLTMLAIFNLLAAFTLYIFSDAQPLQVFIGCAAYSTVGIVFIGSNATFSG